MAKGSDDQSPASFSLLLMQAIETADQQLLQFIFSHRSRQIAKETLKGLTGPDVLVKLVRMMLTTIENHPQQSSDFTFWLRALLVNKKELVMQSEESLDLLRQMKSFFSAKAQNVTRLMSIQGKLQLICQNPAQTATSDEAFVFVDERSDAEDEELELAEKAFGNNQIAVSENAPTEEEVYEEQDSKESSQDESQEDSDEMRFEEEPVEVSAIKASSLKKSKKGTRKVKFKN